MIIGAEKVLPEGSEYPDMSLSSLYRPSLLIRSWSVPILIPVLVVMKNVFMQELHGKEKNNSIKEGLYEYNLRHNQQM